MAKKKYTVSNTRLTEINKDVRNRTGYNLKTVQDITRATFESIVSHLARGETVHITNFARFFCKQFTARLVRLPTEEKVFIPEHLRPKIKYTKIVRNRIKDESTQHAKKKALADRSNKITWPEQ